MHEPKRGMTHSVHGSGTKCSNALFIQAPLTAKSWGRLCLGALRRTKVAAMHSTTKSNDNSISLSPTRDKPHPFAQYYVTYSRKLWRVLYLVNQPNEKYLQVCLKARLMHIHNGTNTHVQLLQRWRFKKKLVTLTQTHQTVKIKSSPNFPAT